MEMYALGLLRKQKSAGSTASYRRRKETGWGGAKKRLSKVGDDLPELNNDQLSRR